MDFERKNEKIREKNESPNDDFFDRIVQWILRRFGEGFKSPKILDFSIFSNCFSKHSWDGELEGQEA